MKDTIHLEQGIVNRNDYARAKLKSLREFGYESLTLLQVQTQIDAALAGKKFGDGLTIIGMFIQKDLKS